MSSAEPEIRYARSGDVHVAYYAVGHGQLDIVFVHGALTNLKVLREELGIRRFYDRLASFSRLIMFDKRGMGLSDHVSVGTLEERMDDIRAVMDAVGSERAVLIEKLGGIAVHIGARVDAKASAGEILVSGTVKDLVAGSGISFEDRGVAELKGVPGSWPLYAVA